MVFRVGLEIVDQPPDSIRPGECVAFRFCVTDHKGHVELIKEAKVHRFLGKNGLVLMVRLRQMNLHFVVNLVIGDEELHVVNISKKNPSGRVIDIPSNASQSQYYIPGNIGYFKETDISVQDNIITLILCIMQPSPIIEDQNSPFRILMRTITRLSETAFTISSRIIVSNNIKTNLSYHKKSLYFALSTQAKFNNDIISKIEDFRSDSAENTLIKILNIFDD